jgi:hypothetical protein
MDDCALGKGHHHLRLSMGPGGHELARWWRCRKSDFDARTYRSITPEENILNACKRIIP